MNEPRYGIYKVPSDTPLDIPRHVFGDGKNWLLQFNTVATLCNLWNRKQEQWYYYYEEQDDGNNTGNII